MAGDAVGDGEAANGATGEETTCVGGRGGAANRGAAGGTTVGRNVVETMSRRN